MVAREWARAHYVASAAEAAGAGSVVFAKSACVSKPTNSPSSRHVSFTNHLGVDARPRLVGLGDVHMQMGRQFSSILQQVLR